MSQGVPFESTPERRNQVEVLAGFGLPQHQIAVLLGCDPKTLRKHFETELAVGDAKATAKVAQTLYNKAVAGDTASLIFWMKARAGWRERTVQEHTGPDGKEPVSIQVRFVSPKLETSSVQELALQHRDIPLLRVAPELSKECEAEPVPKRRIP